MKVYEILSFNKELLCRLSAAGVKHADFKYLDMYHEYTELRNRGYKKIYIVAHLSDKYRVSERQVYAVLGRMESDCKDIAVARAAGTL